MGVRGKARSAFHALAMAAAVCITLTPGASAPFAPPGSGLALTTSSFAANGDIPARFTCDGSDTSPALHWTAPPAATRSFALLVEDPDAPGGVFTHWILFDLPADARALPEGVPKAGAAAGGRQGRNDFGQPGYSGPCPPPGSPHRYVFTLYALDRRLELRPGASKAEVVNALHGHVLAQAEVMGRFRR